MLAFNPVAADILRADEHDREERLRRWRCAWEAYRGDLPDPLKVAMGDPDDNIKLNLARPVVNAGLHFLFGRDVRLTVAGDEAAQTWLDAAWRMNRQATTLLNLGKNGALCGHAFVRIVPDSPLTAPYPRLVVLDPANVAAFWEADDIENIFAYTIEFPDVDRRTGRPLTRRTEIARDGAAWTITDKVAAAGGRWQVVGTPAAWPYPWPPIVHCQNMPCPNEFWGEADLDEDVIAVNRAINTAMSNANRAVRIHAHPWPVGKGLRAEEVDRSLNALILLQNPNASLDLLQAQGVGAADFELYRHLKEALHAIAETPEIATGRLDNIGQLSGLALQILYGPLLAKTQTKRRTYGDMLQALCARLLELGGYGAGAEVTVGWSDPLPKDAEAERRVAEADRRLGASAATLLERLEMDPIKEQERRAQEAQGGTSAA